MANIFLRPTAQFKPFSYQEMLAPIKSYTDAYNNLETEMSNLDLLASSIESKLNPNNTEDREALKKYETFQKDMESALDDFYKSGYTTDAKRKFNALKNQYAKDLDPINKAYERRLEDEKFIRQQKIANPNLIVEGIGGSTMAYMNGNTPSPVVVNLNTVSDAAKNASAGLSKQFMEQIDLQNVEGYIGRYLMHGMKKGIDSNMVKDFTSYIEAVKNDKTGELKTPQGMALYNMFEHIRTANNYDNLTEEGKNRLDASIIQGLVSGAATDTDIKYMADNYWDIEAAKQNIELTKAKLKALRETESGNGTDLDLRTDTTLYKGENFEMSKIARLMENQFKEPIEYNGTKIYDPIQAYNIIHKDDARIAELANRLDRKEFVIRNATGAKVSYDSKGFNKTVYINGRVDQGLTNSLREYEQLIKKRKEAYDALDGIALTDKEVAKVREYSGLPSTGVLSQDDLTKFATKLESDFTAGQYNEESVTIFSHTNSEKGLKDVVGSISKNITTRKEAGVELNITTPDGKYVKPKEIEKLLDKEGKIDVDKIQSIDIDFKAAQTGTVKMITTSGKTYYVEATYLGTQANNFIKGENGLVSQYEELMNSNITGNAKAEILNRRIASTASSIQSQFDLNRNQSMSGTISNKDLFED